MGLLCSARFRIEITAEPVERFLGDLLKGAWFFKKMSGTLDDNQLFRTSELRKRLFVHADDRAIVAADEQQGWCRDPAKVGACEIGPTAARYDGAHRLWLTSRRLQSSPGSRAGAEISRAESPRAGMRL